MDLILQGYLLGTGIIMLLAPGAYLAIVLEKQPKRILETKSQESKTNMKELLW